MSAVVFVGPSLSAADLASGPEAVYLPPAAVGDVYRAARERPDAIGIIDGYFDGVPSVWHKEILWAIREGIPVFGAASMGALRAAELHPFGMCGVGRIFEWFRDGVLEDDDEVALLHGPAETGYLALSEPMVNFRATLERAAREAVIAPASRDTLRDVAKGLFYQDRAWDAVLDHADARRVPEPERAALRAWLPGGRVDAKRADALALLEVIGDPDAAGPPPSFHLEWTTMWDKVVASVSQRSGAGGAAGPESNADVLEELRLDVDGFEAARDAATLRRLCERDARREGVEPDRSALLEAMSRFRSERALFTRAELERWLVDNDMDPGAFEDLMAAEARIDWARSALAPDLDDWLLGVARINGDYARLAARARDKRRILAGRGVDSTTALSTLQLRLWFFESRLGRPIPDDVERFSRRLGFETRDAFDRALAREFLYERETAGAQGEGPAGTR